MALRLFFLLLISLNSAFKCTAKPHITGVHPTLNLSASFPQCFFDVRKIEIHSKFYMSKQLRLQIIIKDVKQLYNCSDDTARRKITQAREALGKEPHQDVTVKEFCNYWGLPEDEVLTQLKLKV